MKTRRFAANCIALLAFVGSPWSLPAIAADEDDVAVNPADAEKPYQRVIDAQQKLVREHPTVARYQGNLARALAVLGEVQNGQGRLDEAQNSYKKAIELQAKLAADNEMVAEYQSGFANMLASLAVLQQRIGTLDKAQETYQRAIDAQEKLITDNPAVPEHKAALARMYLYLGSAERDVRDLATALESEKKAVELYQDVVTEQPAYASHLASALAYYADTLAMAEKWQESADTYGKAIKAEGRIREFRSRRALLQWAAGDKPGYQATCADLINRYAKIDDPVAALYIAQACVVGEDAVQDMSSVIALAERAAKAEPSNPVAKTLVGAAQFRAGKTEEAIATLKVALPQHGFAALAAPKKLDHILLSRLLGESCLGKAYQKLGNHAAVERQVKIVREIIDRLENPPANPGSELMPWSIPLALTISRRELTKLSEQPEQK